MSSENKTTPVQPESVPDLIKKFKLLFVYAAYIVIVGVPMWLYTTSIHQSSLPIQEISQLQHSSIVNYDIPVYIKLPKPLRYLTSDAQSLIDQELSTVVPSSQFHITLKSYPVDKQVDPNQYEIMLEQSENENEAVYVDPFGRSTKLFFTNDLISQGKIPDFIMKVLVYDIFQDEILSYKDNSVSDKLALPYSDHYNLLISLVVEDGSPVEWEVEKAIVDYFQNLVTSISTFTNMTISTQIQYYCTFDLNSTTTGPDNVRYLDLQQLSTFVDLGGWNLVDQIALDPSVNFVIYVPSSQLQIRDSNTNSFIIPQWGGVQIHNRDPNKAVITSSDELLPILEIFASQLLTLLDFPKSPKSLDIRLDILKRIVMRKRLSGTFDTLDSLIKLVNQLLDIPIPEETSKHVEQALQEIRLLGALDAVEDVDGKLIHLNKALALADKLFFDKEMIQQNYFPQAHKLTIYLPIIGPVFMIITNSFLRTLVQYIKVKKSSPK